MGSTAGTGVLVVTHGVAISEDWGGLFLDAVNDAAIPVPTKNVWMVEGKHAIPTLSPRIKSLVKGTLSEAVASFESEKVNKIVVVSFYLFSYGQEQERIKYILGLKPVPEGGTGLRGFDQSQILKHKAKIVISPGMDNHQLVIEILLERAMEISRKPENDAVLIIVKRPGPENLEKIQSSMTLLVDKLKEQGRFKEVRFGFIKELIRTYLPDSVGDEEAENVKKTIALLKTRVEGDVIVLPLFLAEGVTNRVEIPEMIAGQECLYNTKTLLTHINVSRWIREAAEKGIKDLE